MLSFQTKSPNLWKKVFLFILMYGMQGQYCKSSFTKLVSLIRFCTQHFSRLESGLASHGKRQHLCALVFGVKRTEYE